MAIARVSCDQHATISYSRARQSQVSTPAIYIPNVQRVKPTPLPIVSMYPNQSRSSDIHPMSILNL
ncbi:uncharacterized protein M421DRAFT_422754 [Didymella exigua CBS 183.55]|uniref:Uncharacterized protein n=1 Tax=Didymella exigua CBS 183.55 TaxID=1150837 RepID=A0A6A5RG27_9PLEO|nr:uncharacterized protein M421DRAFT_422754 [Didymella exigua CBS 183.55]KAF1926423.1 hypothetical protein M421DRAFT_422754 [Didymella exigua CBS 183.55]